VGFIEAVIYGVVQGLTEFLPISSTAHLRILPELLGQEDPGASFTAVIQIGTLFAILIYFRKDLWSAFLGWVRSMTPGGDKGSLDARIGWSIVIGTIPIVIIGYLFRHQIRSDEVRSLYVVAITLIVMALVLFIAELVGKRRRGLDQVSVKDGIWVGLWQAIALIPGASRSGSTIAGGLFGGLERSTAARFSFLLSVPSITAAGILELIQQRETLLEQGLLAVVVATVVSFVVGYWAIGFLIRYLQTRTTLAFVVYRVGLGLGLLIALQMGALAPQPGQKLAAPVTQDLPEQALLFTAGVR
jgi:undecaprenyl-diphosphatase